MSLEYLGLRGLSLQNEVLNLRPPCSTLEWRPSEDVTKFFQGSSSYRLVDVKSEEVTPEDIVRVNQEKLRDYASKQALTHTVAPGGSQSVTKAFDASDTASRDSLELLNSISEQLDRIIHGADVSSSFNVPVFESLLQLPSLSLSNLSGETGKQTTHMDNSRLSMELIGSTEAIRYSQNLDGEYLMFLACKCMLISNTCARQLCMLIQKFISQHTFTYTYLIYIRY
jgi:hypothetical protein